MSKKYIYVGDPHVKKGNIQEWEALMAFILDLSKKEKIKDLVFLGDAFDTHGTISLEVAHFWKNTIKSLRESFNVYFLVGNHDMILGKGDEYNAPSVILNDENYPNVKIINKPMVINNIAFIPYIKKEEEFYSSSEELFNLGAEETLITHQTFAGSRYDNGFYAPDALDGSKIKQKRIISGHIHKKQTVGNVDYLGTATWASRSDANENKGIHIIEHAPNGEILEITFFSTESVVTPIIELIIEEGKEEVTLPPKGKIYIELVGSTAWIKKAKEKYRGLASIKTTFKDKKANRINKEELKGLTLEVYLDKYFESPLVPKENIVKIISEEL